MQLKICHLYPDLMDLYGDRGNIMALEQRCLWRGIDVEVGHFTIGQALEFKDFDILFIGGGSDREQTILYNDLCARRDNLAAAIEDGLVVLGICGGLQLMGKYYQTAEGKKISGVEILDLWTVAGNKRLIGNVYIELDASLLLNQNQPNTLVGFENHSGQTFLGKAQPLGKVIKGFGNNGQDNQEGVIYKNVFCTYMHGPLLPKNPHFTDLLLSRALTRKSEGAVLPPLDDALELAAHHYMVNRLKQA